MVEEMGNSSVLVLYLLCLDQTGLYFLSARCTGNTLRSEPLHWFCT